MGTAFKSRGGGIIKQRKVIFKPIVSSVIDSPPQRGPSPNAHTQHLPGAHYQNRLPISIPFSLPPSRQNPINVSAPVRGFNPRSATYRSPTPGGKAPEAAQTCLFSTCLLVLQPARLGPAKPSQARSSRPAKGLALRRK